MKSAAVKMVLACLVAGMASAEKTATDPTNAKEPPKKQDGKIECEDWKDCKYKARTAEKAKCFNEEKDKDGPDPTLYIGVDGNKKCDPKHNTLPIVNGQCFLSQELARRPFPSLSFCFRSNLKSCCIQS